MNKLLLPLLAATLLASPVSWGESIERSHEFSRFNRTKPVPTQTARAMSDAVGKTVKTFARNSVRYTKDALGILDAAAQATVNSFIDAGACSERARHPGEQIACGVNLGGGVLAIVWKTAAFEAGNGAYYVGAVVGDWGQVWSDAFNACAAEMGPVAGFPCRVVAIVINAAGQVVRVVGVSIGDTLGYTAHNGALVIVSLANVPASLLRLDPETAVYSLFGAFAGVMCTVVDIIGVVPRIIGGIFGEEVGSACADFN